LALAGIDLRASAACWFDAAYSIFMDAPHEQLDKVWEHMVRAQAKANPDRETWGMLPEHQQLAERAMNANPAPTRGRTRGNGRPA
jgi:hypothetical protein